MGLTIPCKNPISLCYSSQVVSSAIARGYCGALEMESGDFDERQHLMTVNGPLDLRVELFLQDLW